MVGQGAESGDKSIVKSPDVPSGPRLVEGFTAKDWQSAIPDGGKEQDFHKTLIAQNVLPDTKFTDSGQTIKYAGHDLNLDQVKEQLQLLDRVGPAQLDLISKYNQATHSLDGTKIVSDLGFNLSKYPGLNTMPSEGNAEAPNKPAVSAPESQIQSGAVARAPEVKASPAPVAQAPEKISQPKAVDIPPVHNHMQDVLNQDDTMQKKLQHLIPPGVKVEIMPGQNGGPYFQAEGHGLNQALNNLSKAYETDSSVRAAVDALVHDGGSLTMTNNSFKDSRRPELKPMTATADNSHPEKPIVQTSGTGTHAEAQSDGSHLLKGNVKTQGEKPRPMTSTVDAFDPGTNQPDSRFSGGAQDQGDLQHMYLQGTVSGMSDGRSFTISAGPRSRVGIPINQQDGTTISGDMVDSNNRVIGHAEGTLHNNGREAPYIRYRVHDRGGDYDLDMPLSQYRR